MNHQKKSILKQSNYNLPLQSRNYIPYVQESIVIIDIDKLSGEV